MLAASDLIHIPYTPDLTAGGIAIACRSLALNQLHLGDRAAEDFRQSVAGTAVELAFRRYLSGHDIQYKVLGAMPFTHPDQYDICLGGHRCMLKSYLISDRGQVTKIRQEPDRLLKAPALIPVDRFSLEEHKADELYLFAFVLGVAAATLAEVRKAIAAGLPVALVHFLPAAWARAKNWAPLENLILKSECNMPVMLELGGQDSEHEFMNLPLELPPRQPVRVEKSFYSLAYIRIGHRPEGRIGISTNRPHEPMYIIPQYEWKNVWIYGMDIFLTGWLTHAEFHRKAKVLNAGEKSFQHGRTGVKNLMIPVSGLNPLGSLLDQVRAWEAEKQPFNPLPG